MRDTLLVKNAERLTRLGRLGEEIAMERLIACGFSQVANLNASSFNNVFADLVAYRGGTKYIISVKARNRRTQAGELNNSYNLVQIRKSKKRELEERGEGTKEITALLLNEIAALARNASATAAWVTVPVDASTGRYDCYFGTVAALRFGRSIPMTPAACAGYEALARDSFDARILPDMSNGKV